VGSGATLISSLFSLFPSSLLSLNLFFVLIPPLSAPGAWRPPSARPRHGAGDARGRGRPGAGGGGAQAWRRQAAAEAAATARAGGRVRPRRRQRLEQAGAHGAGELPTRRPSRGGGAGGRVTASGAGG